MHHLHPRSRTTSTLFTTTLAISFLVVGLPHILPCPVDRRQFADAPDGQPQQRRRRRRKDDLDDQSERTRLEPEAESSGEGNGPARPARECPVPKPGGLMGQIMGFEQREKETQVPVVVQSLRRRSEKSGGRDEGEGNGGKESEPR